MVDACGPDVAARRILISVYLAIAGLSALLLVWPGGSFLIPGLLAVQIVYKVVTVAGLGMVHPVAMTNLAIAGLHTVTLLIIWRGL